MRSLIVTAVVLLAMTGVASAEVVFFGSKVEGKGREKKDVNAWMEGGWSAKVKPCLAKAATLTTWTVKFDIAKDGSQKFQSVTTRKTGEVGTEKPADETITKCITGTFGDKLPGKATDAVKVSAKFVVN